MPQRPEEEGVDGDQVRHVDIAAPGRNHEPIRQTGRDGPEPRGVPRVLLVAADGTRPKSERDHHRRDSDALVIERTRHRTHQPGGNHRHEESAENANGVRSRALLAQKELRDGRHNPTPNRDEHADVVERHRAEIVGIHQKREDEFEGVGRNPLVLRDLLQQIVNPNSRELHARVNRSADGAAERVPGLVVEPRHPQNCDINNVLLCF